MISCYPFQKPVQPILVAFASVLILMGCATLPGSSSSHSETSPPGVINLYQGSLNHLSAVRRGACPMHPSCSEYARQAMDKHGPIKGWVMATDRLMRCGRDETRLAPKVWVNGHIKFYDPLDQNDFWWTNNRKSDLSPKSTGMPDS